jgi:hypothetical protein
MEATLVTSSVEVSPGAMDDPFATSWRNAGVMRITS